MSVSQAGPFVARIATLTTSDDPATAVAYGDALLRQYGVMPRTATLETRWLDFLPGQTVDVDFPAVGSGGILADRYRADPARPATMPAEYPGTAQHQWIARLTLVEGDETRGSWLDFWRQAMSGGGGVLLELTGPGTGGGGGGVTVNGGPMYAGGSREVAITPGDRRVLATGRGVRGCALPASATAWPPWTFRCHPGWCRQPAR